ncbi:CAP domain-containing protein [Aquincola tertiaricarbonis]|uniref:CAP domain-containing protein n=1 Tax=Aquincola tertiaricarbonis TaxID=391953 RepID=UPI0012ECDFE5|nr:hypothetical protein [Aquincola tertiaricarbonis]
MQAPIRFASHTTFALLVVAAAALSACGGGGGGGDSTSTSPLSPRPPTVPEVPSVPVPPVVAPAPSKPVTVDPVTTVPAPTYMPGSVAAVAFDLLNSERSRCGFGKVAQNAKLDTAAGWHAEYQRLRFMDGEAGGHLEDANKSGFQAITPNERGTKAGYVGGSGEFISYRGIGTASNMGDALVRSLLGSVYHLAGSFDGYRDAGVGVSFAEGGLNPVATLNWTVGQPTDVPRQEPADVVTYPCEGTTGVQPSMRGEAPDPFAGLGFAADEHVGQPIYVRAPAGKEIDLLSATITSSTGDSIPVFLYHASQDPHKVLTGNQAFVIPRQGLAQETTYTVQVQGTTDGIGFARTFSFTTMKW